MFLKIELKTKDKEINSLIIHVNDNTVPNIEKNNLTEKPLKCSCEVKISNLNYKINQLKIVNLKLMETIQPFTVSDKQALKEAEDVNYTN